MSPPNLTKTDLTAELTNLENARLDEIDAGTGVEDALDGVLQTRPQPTETDADQGRVARTVIARSPQDDARSAIANRFKRSAQDIPFDGDLTNPENLYGAAGRAPALEPDPDATIVGETIDPNLDDDEYDRQTAARETQQPKTRELMVRGKKVTMTEDEILAAAQKTLAADTYLEDARKLLEEAKDIKAERAGRDPQHPEGRTHTQDDGDIDPATETSQHPDDEYEQLAESLQYGDPKENGKRLKGLVQKEAGKAAGEDHINRLFNNDLAKSQKALKDFEQANPDLANDEISRLAIERTMYGLYREDIIKLGLDESQIPSSPRELANWHRFYKVHGHEVRNTPELLQIAKGKFEAWRGVSPNPNPKPAPRKEAPRVEVNVDRTRRREGIPNQPNRAVVPRRDAQQAPAKTPGSDVVAQMRKARGQV